LNTSPPTLSPPSSADQVSNAARCAASTDLKGMSKLLPSPAVCTGVVERWLLLAAAAATTGQPDFSKTKEGFPTNQHSEDIRSTNMEGASFCCSQRCISDNITGCSRFRVPPQLACYADGQEQRPIGNNVYTGARACARCDKSTPADGRRKHIQSFELGTPVARQRLLALLADDQQTMHTAAMGYQSETR